MLSTLKFIIRHPFNKHRPIAAIINYFKWQIISRLNPYPILYNWVNGSKILAWKGLTGVTGNIYCGLHEYEDMAFVLHFLRPGDLFVDAGANIGSYTVLAATTGAEVIAVEPLPQTFKILQRNIGVNVFEQQIRAVNVGLASQPGVLYFTNNLDTVNHVVSSGTPDAVAVEVNTIDIICSGRVPVLIKMDVEGFESEVLKGADTVLRNTELKALIIELNDSANQYNYNMEVIPEWLLNYGFKRVQYDPADRRIQRFETASKTGNGLFVRDSAFIESRVSKIMNYSIGGIKI